MTGIKENIKKLIGEEKFNALMNLISTHKFAELTAKDGSMLVHEGELAEGVPVFIVTAEGNMPVPDGVVELADGTLLEVAAGLITKITKMAAADPAKMSEGLTPEVVDYVTKAKEELQAQIDELKSLLAEFKKVEPGQPSELNEEVKNALAELLAAKQEFSSATNADKSKFEKINERFDGVVQILEEVLKMPVADPKEQTPAQKSKKDERIAAFAATLKKIR